MQTSDLLAFIGPSYLIAVAWPLAKIDLREHRLPNRLVVPSFGVTLLAQSSAVLAGASSQQMLWAWLFAISVFVLGLAANLWAGLGMGDVKLLAAIAAALGWWGSTAVFLAILAGFALAALVSLVRVALRRASSRQAIALGPYLLGGLLLSSAACCTAA